MSPSKRRPFIIFILSIISIAGVALALSFFSQPSEAGNRFLLGLSLPRFLIGLIFFLLLSVSLAATLFAVVERLSWGEKFVNIWNALFSTGIGLYGVVTSLYVLFLTCGGMLFLTQLPVAKHAEVYMGIITRLIPLLLWLFLSSLLLFVWIVLFYKETIRRDDFFSPLKTVAWVLLFLATYILVVMYYRNAAYVLSLRHFEPPLLWLGTYLLFWACVNEYASRTGRQVVLERFFFLTGIFLISFVLYGHVAVWVDWVHKGRYEYWDLLAKQFLQGKLYLPDPANIKLAHDLTPYQGKWYIPNPPLPAVLMMPLALFLKPEDIYMGEVSIFFSALNILLVYLILEQLLMRQWIKISKSAILWLTVLFGFGTNHLWVGINGGVWFVSQILTVTFSALAIFASLKSWSPWLVGLGLALALGVRPNSLMTWPLVFAIAMQVIKENGSHLDLKQILIWSVKSAIPIGLGVVSLLWYNHARFDDYLDFGYTTINGDPTIVKNAQAYGIFSMVYIKHNLEVMFLSLPKVNWGNPWLLSPAKAGMSIFLSTPPLIYLVRRYENQWWILGAWTAMFLNFTLLMLYHNTGADQFGYRYILDLIIPILALMAWSFKDKIPWHFYILLLFSIVMNLYGAAWFMNGPS